MEMSKKPWPILSVNSIMGKVNTNPPYQRPPVWSTAQKQLLIDTIIRGYDIPKLYWRKVNRPPFQYEVIDGQQRLLAIHEFIADKFSLPNNADPTSEGVLLAGLKYSELPDDLRIEFDSYSLDIVIVVSEDAEEVQEMFLRLQNGTSLKAQEKRNAMPGAMRDFVKRISSHDFFKSVNFKDSRYTYDLIAAQICLLELKGCPCNVKNSDLNKMYFDYKDFDDKTKAAKKIFRVLDFLHEMYPEKHPDLTRYSVISLYAIVSAMIDKYVVKTRAQELRAWFSNFETYRIAEEKKDVESQDPEIIAYHERISHSSDAVDSIKFRHDYLMKLLFATVTNLEMKDSQREFDASQRAAIYRRDGGRCQLCGEMCAWDDWHADHIKPWISGGQTIVENGQVLCPTCNLKKGAST